MPQEKPGQLHLSILLYMEQFMKIHQIQTKIQNVAPLGIETFDGQVVSYLEAHKLFHLNKAVLKTNIKIYLRTPLHSFIFLNLSSLLMCLHTKVLSGTFT